MGRGRAGGRSRGRAGTEQGKVEPFRRLVAKAKPCRRPAVKAKPLGRLAANMERLGRPTKQQDWRPATGVLS